MKERNMRRRKEGWGAVWLLIERSGEKIGEKGESRKEKMELRR